MNTKLFVIYVSFPLQHCVLDSSIHGQYTKDLSMILSDMSSVFIIDNSPSAYKNYPGIVKFTFLKHYDYFRRYLYVSTHKS